MPGYDVPEPPPPSLLAAVKVGVAQGGDLLGWHRAHAAGLPHSVPLAGHPRVPTALRVLGPRAVPCACVSGGIGSARAPPQGSEALFPPGLTPFRPARPPLAQGTES